MLELGLGLELEFWLGLPLTACTQCKVATKKHSSILNYYGGFCAVPCQITDKVGKNPVRWWGWYYLWNNSINVCLGALHVKLFMDGKCPKL